MKQIRLTLQVRRELKGKTITYVGNDYIVLDNGCRIYLDDDEIDMLGGEMIPPDVTVKFGETEFLFENPEAEDWRTDGDYDYYYDLQSNLITVYRVKDGETDTTQIVHKQDIIV